MMECSTSQLLNLPDEILIIICKKLDNVEMLYSLFNVDIRLDQVISDPIFTTPLTLVKQNASVDLTASLSDLVLNRFCSEILPHIYPKIKWLSVETLSMERILLAAPDYPNLCQLDIFIMNEDIDMDLFTDQSPRRHLFQKQILTLCVNGKIVTQDCSKLNLLAKLFVNIIRLFNNVRLLKFYSSAPMGAGFISFAKQCPRFSSSLVELYINVYRFDDCLSLLDGRFNQLRILIVRTFYIFPVELEIVNTAKLLSLKHFSLHCINETFLCDEIIVPHLQRMINLENLGLYIATDYPNTFIDGDYLKKNISNCMPRLNEFTFHIRSMVQTSDPIHLPSNEYIHSTFENFKNSEIITYVDYFPRAKYGQCHVYTYPYTLNYYEAITNNFPGGLFNTVEEIELFDEHPFHHEFFVKISQAFPFLKQLTMVNFKPQNIDDHTNFSVIEYSQLTTIRLIRVHDHYVKQFLFDTKACLPNFIQFKVNYYQLQRVTDHFTSDKTRNNCSKIKRISFHDDLQLPIDYRTYFPHLE